MKNLELNWTTVGLATLVALSGAVHAYALNAQEIIELSASDRRLTPQLEELYSIGSLAGEGWEMFSSVDDSNLGFDAAGNLYILDRQGLRIVVVDLDGNLIREVGREGDGPGEFKIPKALAVHRDGSFAVYDRGHFAIMYFGPDREILEHATVDISEIPSGKMLPSHDGSLISVGGLDLIQTLDGEPTQKGPLRRYPPLGNGSITVLHSAGAPPGSFPFDLSQIVGSATQSLAAFQPKASFGVRPDGTIALSDSVTYRITLLDSSGRITKTLHRSIEPRPVTLGDQDREKEYRLAEVENSEVPGAVLGVGRGRAARAAGEEGIKESRRRSIENMQFAEEFPVLSGVAVDWEGRIWAERTGENPNGPGPIDVIGADDSYLGTISEDGMRIPFAFGPDGLVAYVETDEFDVPKVVVKRVSLGR